MIKLFFYIAVLGLSNVIFFLFGVNVGEQRMIDTYQRPIASLMRFTAFSLRVSEKDDLAAEFDRIASMPLIVTGDAKFQKAEELNRLSLRIDH